MLTWILDRLREPSTWAGFSGLFMALGLSDALVGAIAAAGAAVAALIAVVVNERSADE